MGSSHERGRAAEAVAQAALTAAGYTVIESNFRVRGAEVDIIGRDPEGFVFVEVRARGPGDVDPSASIDGKKFQALMRGARAWLARRNRADADWRLIVVAVDLDVDGRPLRTSIIEDPFAHLPEFHHGDP